MAFNGIIFMQISRNCKDEYFSALLHGRHFLPPLASTGHTFYVTVLQ